MTDAPGGLRRVAIEGAAYLVARQIAGGALAFGGMIAVTRLIGPAHFGLYSAALGILLFLQQVGQAGLGVYLVRKATDDQDRESDQVFTLTLLSGPLVAGLAVFGAHRTETWLGLQGLTPVMATLGFGLILPMLAVVPLARIERRLDFRRIAAIEIRAQLAGLGAALPVAAVRGDVWAPVVGWWVQQVSALAMAGIAAGYRPKVSWDWRRARAALSYGLSYALSASLWQARGLVNPVIVGRFAGAEAVGLVALTLRLIDALGVARGAAHRISIAVMGRMQDDLTRLRRAIAEGSQLEVLAVGPPLAVFSLLAPHLVPFLLGDRWAALAAIFPLVASAFLAGTLFHLCSSTLYVLGWNRDVAAFHATSAVLLAAVASVLVPGMGAAGFGWSDVVSSVSFAVIYWFCRRRIGAPGLEVAGLWTAAFALTILGGMYWWLVPAGVAILALPRSRRALKGTWTAVFVRG